jgi:predicted phage terminase large subunit-like protein
LRKLSESEQTARLRDLCRTDLFFLLRYGLGRADIERQWLFDRCREVQADPNGRLDLWAREHYKSTIITFGQTIQDILADPELTIGIFSHTRPIAKGFLRQIKREFEANEQLKAWFPDILYAAPQKESPKWSEDEGIVVKRRSNPKEATVEAWGLVDGQPTSKHYKRMIYDDVVTRESVTTPEMIAKTTEAWELSRNLGSEGGSTRYIGTRYHYNDSYREIINRRAAVPRIYPATRDGTVEGEPVLLTRERLAEKRREQGPYTFGCQMLQDPKADGAQGFKADWLRYYDRHNDGAGMNKVILVDAASEKRKTSDYTAMWVIGLSTDQNFYVLDMIRDRLRLTERADALFALHRRWRPQKVGYEKYGLMADIEHVKDRMERENYRFPIEELGGPMPKPDRIKRLIPLFEQGRVWLPHSLHKTDYEGLVRELVGVFIEEEYKAFPVGLHDDMLDALARLCDEELGLIWPEQEEKPKNRYARRLYDRRGSGSYMSV